MQYRVTIKFALHQSSYSICATNRLDVQSEPKEPEVKHTKRLHVVCNVHKRIQCTVYTILYYNGSRRNATSAREEGTAKTNTNRTSLFELPSSYVCTCVLIYIYFHIYYYTLEQQ